MKYRLSILYKQFPGITTYDTTDWVAWTTRMCFLTVLEREVEDQNTEMKEHYLFLGLAGQPCDCSCTTKALCLSKQQTWTAGYIYQLLVYTMRK